MTKEEALRASRHLQGRDWTNALRSLPPNDRWLSGLVNDEWRDTNSRLALRSLIAHITRAFDAAALLPLTEGDDEDRFTGLLQGYCQRGPVVRWRLVFRAVWAAFVRAADADRVVEQSAVSWCFRDLGNSGNRLTAAWTVWRELVKTVAALRSNEVVAGGAVRDAERDWACRRLLVFHLSAVSDTEDRVASFPEDFRISLAHAERALAMAREVETRRRDAARLQAERRHLYEQHPSDAVLGKPDHEAIVVLRAERARVQARLRLEAVRAMAAKVRGAAEQGHGLLSVPPAAADPMAT